MSKKKILYIRLDSSPLPEACDEIIVKDFNLESYFCTLLGKRLLEEVRIHKSVSFPGKIITDFKQSSPETYHALIGQWEKILARLLSANEGGCMRFKMDIPPTFYDWLSHQDDTIYREIGKRPIRQLVFTRDVLYESLVASTLLKRLRYTLGKMNENIGSLFIGSWLSNGKTWLTEYLRQINDNFRNANIKYIHVMHIDCKDDGSWHSHIMPRGCVDMEGNECVFVGTVRLTRYMEEVEYTSIKTRFPDLTIKQPEYTMIEFDNSVSNDANVSNLDNRTGYKYGNSYVPSGHIKVLLSRRHRVLAKVTRKPTTRRVTIAGVDTTMNNLDGEATYIELDDTNSYRYADGTEAKLDGTEGNWMMKEPCYWSKGINDYLNDKNYACYSSNGPDEMPECPEAVVWSLDDIKATTDGYFGGTKVITGKANIANAICMDSSYSICKVNVSGFKRVRFPGVCGTDQAGAVFVDGKGSILEPVVVSPSAGNFKDGMYLIKDVPVGAEFLYFSILNTAEFDKVVLSHSNRIEDMEPDWVFNDEFLCGVVGSSKVGGRLRACISGGSTAASRSWIEFHNYSADCGMQQIDAMMHFHIANLCYAKYGRRNMRAQCGAGSDSYNRITGGTASYGMKDTLGPGLTTGNICCLGYEDIYGHKYDMMDGVDVPNTPGNEGKWRIWMPDGTVRWVQGRRGGGWIVAVAHGKYMDGVPVGTNGGEELYYSNDYFINISSNRVVYRGYRYANANGGVSHANASVDASYTNTYVGSRLAFRGKIVKAESVKVFKTINEIV